MSERTTDYETSTRVFAALLQHWRAEFGWTRREAADQLGVPPTTFDGWLDGRPCGQEVAMRKLMQRIAIEKRKL